MFGVSPFATVEYAGLMIHEQGLVDDGLNRIYEVKEDIFKHKHKNSFFSNKPDKFTKKIY